MDALFPATGCAADASALAACTILAEDARQCALGAALALHAVLCGARCNPHRYPDPTSSSGPAAAALVGPASLAEEVADVAPGADAGSRGAAEASPARASGAAGSSGAAALLARAAEAVALLLDAASERLVRRPQPSPGALPSLNIIA